MQYVWAQTNTDDQLKQCPGTADPSLRGTWKSSGERSTTDDEGTAADRMGEIDPTRATGRSSSHNSFEHEAATIGDRLPSPPPPPPSSSPSSSSPSNTSGPDSLARHPRSPNGGRAGLPTGQQEVATRRSLMDAKDRAMLSREINVIVLGGHKKYDAWKQDLQLKLNEWGLMEFLDGDAVFDEARAAFDSEYWFLFGEWRTKSFSALALSLSIKLREEFKGPIETQDPAVLYSALKAHFERGKECNKVTRKWLHVATWLHGVFSNVGVRHTNGYTFQTAGLYAFRLPIGR
ncbi:hypothetical protein PC129_g19124 [Phytophthora cactorum]|uniref:Uncharacterized protein n=1 Tax=Phytophthora cactorum TaxID=29920 RepID=A0A329RBA5_9STRA|nr:hypothetical protein Pcac1_g26996 [Phytophthora cactorum]KAG2791847.1 hypothetical protein PC111_g23733 [Phytophthora cactorum]KAG2801082.1 hypothetical protein PC112_g20196 [Phytophthora cactorum]KAG2816626.1 hypothetical protein PC113_g23068 [Phytophthora cactorum]KAG2871810.1 hypothetical protein PC114_g26714 [Phytophthora cactorum]